MRTIQQIYSDYKIMPNLQLHQLRVASVAKIIAENFKEKLDKESIVIACLFHDMGNIIKFNFSYFTEFLKPEGLEYWQAVKNEYIKHLQGKAPQFLNITLYFFISNFVWFNASLAKNIFFNVS